MPERHLSDAPLREVVLLLLPGFSNLCLATAVEPLRAANELAGEQLYSWRLVSFDSEGDRTSGGRSSSAHSPIARSSSVRSSSGLDLHVSGTLAEQKPADALFVVAAAQYADSATRPILAELRRAARSFRTLGGFDTGSHLLAAAGLLDGYSATVHWEELETFAESFPDIDASRSRYVIDRNRVTAGGATTVLDLMLDVIGKQDGLALALAVAGRLIYDPAIEGPAHAGPTSGDPAYGGPGSGDLAPQQTVPLRFIARKDEAVSAAIGLMDSHIEDPLTIGRIAALSGIGLRDLERRFHRHIGTSPGEYYRSLRLAVARRLVEETEFSVGEIAARSGFGSASALARAFKHRYNLGPRAFRARLRSTAYMSGPWPG